MKLYPFALLAAVLSGCAMAPTHPDSVRPGDEDGVAQRIESNSPLDLFILMLGTNDFQSTHNNDARQSAQGIAAIIEAVRAAPIEPGMRAPKIMVIAPPSITKPKGSIAEKFEGSTQRCIGLSAEYAKVAAEHDCSFFDAAAIVSTSPIVGVHLDAAQHLRLAQALVSPIAEELCCSE